MNYIELNGKRNTDCNGLLISSLPPISKPLMRTEIEEIDGRDGDIVTKLGYAAYDKEVQVGLHGSYNVDDVIAFFDSEGKVIFSNEPDKYYNYQIIEQIDFERLIRFRRGTVTFHVQPFKYGAVDRKFTLSNRYVRFADYTRSIKGVTLSARNGRNITITGTSTAGTMFYLPIFPARLAAGNYTMSVLATGTNVSECTVRLIKDKPLNVSSFGGTYIRPEAGVTKTLQDTVTGYRDYNYLLFYVNAGKTVNIAFDISLENDDFDSLSLINRGNIFSRPKVTIYGSGTINLAINGVQRFVIDLSNDAYITLDGAKMDAYKGGILMNRKVTGDYRNLVLGIGKNAISWTGDVDEIIVEDFSRWR